MNHPDLIEIHWHYSDPYWAGRAITDRLVQQRLEDEYGEEYAGCFLDLVEKILRDNDHITILVAIYQ